MIGKDIQQAVHYLQEGDVVGIPTETVYGLAGNAFDTKAIQKIYSIKQRPWGDPLIVHTHSITKVYDMVHSLPDAASVLAQHFWPGALTLILPKKEHIASMITAGMPYVGIRVPSHPIAQELLRLLDFPLAAPSANPFGYVSPTTAQHVANQLGKKIPYILDGGSCKQGLESTIVGFPNNKPTIYRLGSITLEEISRVIGKVHYEEKHYDVDIQARAPGTFAHHYAPHSTVVIGCIEQLIQQYQGRKVGALLFTPKRIPLPKEQIFVLSFSESLQEAAQRLFAGLRYLDDIGCDVIVAPQLPNYRLGKTINERLQRASYRL